MNEKIKYFLEYESLGGWLTPKGYEYYKTYKLEITEQILLNRARSNFGGVKNIHKPSDGVSLRSKETPAPFAEI